MLWIGVLELEELIDFNFKRKLFSLLQGDDFFFLSLSSNLSERNSYQFSESEWRKSINILQILL
jgi:hypothetical protein